MTIPRAFVLGLMLAALEATACSAAQEPDLEGDEQTPATDGSPPEPGAAGDPSSGDGRPPAPAAFTPAASTPAGPDSSSELPAPPALERPPASADASGGASPDTDAAPPAASCSRPSSLAAGDRTLRLEHDGEQREFIVHVPQNLDPARPVPLVVDMHGLTSSAGAQARLSGWRAKADAEGFIVAHPQGLGNSWNGGDLCCGSAQRSGVDDEGFIRAMVARIAEDGCVDPRRIYATGLSNGGAMSHLLGCNAADLFAAVAPVSMGNGTRPCQPSRPISVVLTRGTQDLLVAFNGGLFPSAEADFEQWARLNGCEGEPEPAGELCRAFTRCAAGVEVKACALDAGHVLYDNRQNFSVPDVVWETFERQTLP